MENFLFCVVYTLHAFAFVLLRQDYLFTIGFLKRYL